MDELLAERQRLNFAIAENRRLQILALRRSLHPQFNAYKKMKEYSEFLKLRDIEMPALESEYTRVCDNLIQSLSGTNEP
jgi:hypothetical protein